MFLLIIGVDVAGGGGGCVDVNRVCTVWICCVLCVLLLTAFVHHYLFPLTPSHSTLPPSTEIDFIEPEHVLLFLHLTAGPSP